MLHEPAHQEHGLDESSAYKRRLGLQMLLVYGIFYIVFIVINVAWPSVMGTIVVAGLNLAIVYGFALIAVAFILAIVYTVACTRHERSFEGERKA